MALDKNLLKLGALVIVGGVAKELFGDHPPVTKNYYPTVREDKEPLEKPKSYPDNSPKTAAGDKY